jgi:hypothetical protein
MKTEDAKKTLDSLEYKLSGARQRLNETKAMAAEVSYDAHTQGGEAAERLNRLKSDETMWTQEIASLEAAVATAKKHVTHANAAETDAAERVNATKALGLLDDFAKRGAELDARLQGFIDEYGDLCSDFRKLEALGFAPATLPLIHSNMKRAVATKLMFSDLQSEFLAPHDRRDFVSVIEGWASNVRGRITARLNRNKAAKAA